MDRAELDRILAADYLGDLEVRPLDEIRSMRGECQQIEVGLSFLRRLAQARLDIIDGELRRRVEGGDPNDLADLIGKLPEILSDRVTSPGFGRLPQHLAPGESEADLAADVDAIVDADLLPSLPEMDDDAVWGLREELTRFEQEMSERRRAVHQRIDALQAEITRRYRTGEASVESLLR